MDPWRLQRRDVVSFASIAALAQQLQVGVLIAADTPRQDMINSNVGVVC
jgi:hypothetical protein